MLYKGGSLMKIKTTICFTILYFFPLIYSMDEAPKEDPKKKKERIATDSSAIIIPITETADLEKEKRKSVVPPIDLAVMQQQQANGSSSEGQRTPVKTMEHLKKAVSTKALTSRRIEGATTRRLITRSRATPSEGEPVAATAILDTAVKKAPSLLPKSLPERRLSTRHLFNIQDEKMYTEDELWEKLEHANPALCNFAKAHRMSLDEFDEYAVLMQELDIDPRVITEYAHQNHPETEMHWFNQGLAYMFRESKEKNVERLHKEYDKIKRENPENYKVLVLELMKYAAEEADGVPRRSLIADTHTSLQNDEINAQATQIRQQWLALIVAGATMIGGWVTSGIQYFAPVVVQNCTGV